jgi:putative Mg2+ transporter-C (MgtC) family protein
MEIPFLTPQLEEFFQLILAAFLGGLIGFERERKGKAAGLRTYTLVCVGATLFTMIAMRSFMLFGSETSSFDPSRIVGQLVLGVSFLGGGVIFLREQHVSGLTTAAGLWVTVAIGAAIGLYLYRLAIFSAALSILILSVFRLIEKRLVEQKGE